VEGILVRTAPARNLPNCPTCIAGIQMLDPPGYFDLKFDDVPLAHSSRRGLPPVIFSFVGE
jgi:hypothetical protein